MMLGLMIWPKSSTQVVDTDSGALIFQEDLSKILQETGINLDTVNQEGE